MLDKEGRTVLIDFGLAHRFCDSKGRHLRDQSARVFKGTVMFCSQNTLLKKRQSRRDDLESLLYLVIRLCDINLPWQHLAKGYSSKEMCSIRAKMTVGEIESGLPKPFKPIYRYVSSLELTAEPDYEKMV